MHWQLRHGQKNKRSVECPGTEWILGRLLLKPYNRKNKNGPPTIYTRESTGYQPPSPANIPITQNEKNKATLQQQQQLSAPLLSES